MKTVFPGSICWINDSDHAEADETAIMSKNLPFHTALCILSIAVDECVRNESPVVYVDACSCGEEGRLIIAGFMDMSRHVQPIGCYYVDEETDVTYSVFFSELLRAGLTNKNRIAVVSDGTPSIHAAFEKTFADRIAAGRAIHIRCCDIEKRRMIDYMYRTLKYNPKTHEDTEKVSRVQRLFYHVRNARNEETRAAYLTKISEIDPRVGNYIRNLGGSNYLSRLPFPVFSQLSINPCESMMARLKLKENEGRALRSSNVFDVFQRFVLVAVKSVDSRFNKLELHPVVEGEVEYPDAVYCSFVVKTLVRLGCIYEVFRDQFVVKENTVFDDGWNETFVVDLEKRECTCLSFQQNKFPCIHAIAVLHTREQFGSVFSYVDDCYKRRTVSQTCQKIPEETWNALEFDCDRDYDAVEDISGCEEDDVQWLQVDTTKRAHSEGEWSLICDSVEGDEATPLEKRVAGVKDSSWE